MLLSSSVPCQTSTCKCLLARATVLQEVETQKKQIRQLRNEMIENPSMCPVCQCDSGAGLALHTQWEDGESPG